MARSLMVAVGIARQVEHMLTLLLFFGCSKNVVLWILDIVG